MSHQYPLIYFCESFYLFYHTYFSLSFYGPFIFSCPLFPFHLFYLLISLRSHSSLPFMRAHFYMIYLITLNHANSLFYFLFLSYVLFFFYQKRRSVSSIHGINQLSYVKLLVNRIAQECEWL